MNGNVSYAKRLRALGQALERLEIRTLDMEVDDGLFLVWGEFDGMKGGDLTKLSSQMLLQTAIRNAYSRLLSNVGLPRKPSVAELQYSAAEIEDLDSEGRKNRRDTDGAPDPYSLSQILRGAGFYQDHKSELRLKGISVENRWVTVRYETADGHCEEETHGIEVLYNFWIKMYLKRSGRNLNPLLP